MVRNAISLFKIFYTMISDGERYPLVILKLLYATLVGIEIKVRFQTLFPVEETIYWPTVTCMANSKFWT